MRHMRHLRSIGCAGSLLLLLIITNGCIDPAASSAPPVSVTASAPAPTPTLPPTAVPGSDADSREVEHTVAQFGTALVRGDDLVAVLVLSPSAQQTVASGNLRSFLGIDTPPQQFSVDMIQLQGDMATVETTLVSGGVSQQILLRLVRLDGVWKIDSRID